MDKKLRDELAREQELDGTWGGPRRQGGYLAWRTDDEGFRVCVLPARCRYGEHQLSATGYQAIDLRRGLIYVSCLACRETTPSRPYEAWALSTSGGGSALRAELNDEPYIKLRAEIAARRK